MGMITRVRGRIHSVTKLNGQYYHEEKIAQTICLLCMVILMPYIGNGCCGLPVLLGVFSWLNSYTCVAAPLLVTAKEKYQPHSGIACDYLQQTLQLLIKYGQKCQKPALSFLKKIYQPLDKLERKFFEMKNIYNLLNQILFFLMCDKFINRYGDTTNPSQHVTSLYSLMFYNVISYCVYYIQDLISKENWSPYVHITKTSNVKHLAMSATKIVLEFTKAVTFIMTIIFMLLVFGLEDKLENYHPNKFYTLITLIYYMCTEKVFVNLLLKLTLYLQLEIFESLESLYVPVILQSLTLILSIIFTFPLIFYGEFRLILFAGYLNIYLKYKQLNIYELKLLKEEQTVLTPFRHATSDELNGFDDICAVCLSSMKFARITPCHHLFHANCLRQCLQNSNNCPICKQEYKIIK